MEAGRPARHPPADRYRSRVPLPYPHPLRCRAPQRACRAPAFGCRASWRQAAPPGFPLIRHRIEPSAAALRSGGRRLAALLDPRGLAAQPPEVVELGAPDLAPRHRLDLVNGRAVHGEGALNAHAVADLADGERLPY